MKGYVNRGHHVLADLNLYDRLLYTMKTTDNTILTYKHSMCDVIRTFTIMIMLLVIASPSTGVHPDRERNLNVLCDIS